jgi:hypothetical protein
VSSFEDDFLQGQKDCRNGVEHKPMQSEAYNRGYATQYEKEQIDTEMSK